jgi:hypothetical protein
MESEIGDEAAAEPIAFGGPMYDEATARKILEEADDGDPDDNAAFNPDDAKLDDLYYIESWGAYFTPILYYCYTGDVKMCRYLVSRGASTTKSSEDDDHPQYVTFPMLQAAYEGYLDICKVLHANGAQNDIWRVDGAGRTPFYAAACNGNDEVVQWLTLHGALCADGSSEGIEGNAIYPRLYLVDDIEDWRRHDRNIIARSCERLVQWAEGVTQTHSAVVTFLLGTQPRAPDTVQNRMLQCLCGHCGVRKHIGDFVGLEVTKEKQLRILRNVMDVVPSFIKTDYEEQDIESTNIA